MTENVIIAEKLGRRFGRHWAVRGLDLAVPKGAVYGFLGRNGAGKSTTIKMLLGLLLPTEGSASVLGLDPVREDVPLKARIGYVPEVPVFYDWMTLDEIVAFVAHYRGERWDDTYAAHLLAQFQLPRDRRLQEMSKGQRAKVSLLLAMGFRPDVLLLDEPTGGLDPIARREFIEGVLSEYMEGDQTILISSHLIQEISGLVDHVGIIAEGRLVRTGTAEQVLLGFRSYRITFPSEETTPARLPDLPDRLGARRHGREWTFALAEAADDAVRGAFPGLAADAVVSERMGLEDAFVALLGGEEREP